MDDKYNEYIRDFLETCKVVSGSPTNMYSPSSGQRVSTMKNWIVGGGQRSRYKTEEQLEYIKLVLEQYLKDNHV